MVIVSVDSAYTEKEENDPTGCTTWGLFTDQADGYPKVLLLAAWRAHLQLHGEVQPPQRRDETEAEYLRRCYPHWGICERVAWSCSRFGGADYLLIENKASGQDVIGWIDPRALDDDGELLSPRELEARQDELFIRPAIDS
jgi:hypothetical protein